MGVINTLGISTEDYMKSQPKIGIMVVYAWMSPYEDGINIEVTTPMSWTLVLK